MSETVVSLRGVTKYYGSKCAVYETDLDLKEGQVYGLVGVNGSGKTTALKMILGLLEPTRGNITVFGHAACAMPPEIRNRIAYVAERHPLYREMSVAGIAEYQRSFFNHWDQSVFDELAYAFGLRPEDIIRKISNGQRAQVYLALAIAQQPDLLIMDDPTLGIDPIVRKQFLEAVVQIMHQKKRTAIFTSHIIDDIDRIADHLFVMNEGRLLASCPLSVFSERVKRFSMRFAEQVPCLDTLKNIRWVQEDSSTALVTFLDFDETTRSRLMQLGARDIAEAPSSLEDLFIDFTRESYIQLRATREKA